MAKSEFGISKEYTVTFDPIDTPTEKELAEIREINARTDATYINAGVVSAEEVRGILREDERSGYNALAEEIEGESLTDEDDPFRDLEGDSESSQDPFSMDEEPKDWFTSNGAHIPIMKGKEQTEAFEDFTKEKQTSEKEKQHKIDSVKIDKNKDNILPELNKEEQEQLNVGNKKVRLKKKIIDINSKHDDVNKGDDDFLIGSALYSPEIVIPAKTNGYYHFIKRVWNDRNSLVLLDLKSDGEYLDIVHYYYQNDKSRRRTEKNH